jgi:sec-independent protein translocase protein TatA|tara:strand:+ start:20 stop:415 length:396 start_codon:yes stop_codon:yes gene_type:complete
MFSYSLQIIATEWLWIIFLIVFLLFGSKKLPEVSRNLGKAMREIQKGRAEIEREFKTATSLPESKTKKPNKIYKAPDYPTGISPEKNVENKGNSEEAIPKDTANSTDNKPTKKDIPKNIGKGKANTAPKKK